MKKDIEFHPVRGVKVAIVRTVNAIEEADWSVILINGNDQPISNVFVTSKGYSNGESGPASDQRTSVLRHFFPEIDPRTHVVIEPIMPEVFHLNNEFWISYYIGRQIYDKKFIFVPDSIVENNLILIDPPGLEGVLHE
ncbi:hypothetical protein [Dyadobacter sandarakinus]|uniref:Uncharacterized protein n=1 Tax=Dyadobacter sandarakinus TaxID=2747268 RepID=A0ABX7I9Z3_9BACT|nr:hypothetical protein [Dyadobacter sandarakinus]QRR02936.1 hypothetical protein HWI92_19490 [Dyadobacter sandarakinus]